MSPLYRIDTLTQLAAPSLDALLAESQAEGFRFVAKLLKAYEQGSNRFDQAGECLLGMFTHDNELVAIGGLNQDPYQQKPHQGRLRHFYVLSAHRQQGLGFALLMALINAAVPHFTHLTLRTPGTQASARFYERHGFLPATSEHNSHCLALVRSDIHPQKTH